MLQALATSKTRVLRQFFVKELGDLRTARDSVERVAEPNGQKALGRAAGSCGYGAVCRIADQLSNARHTVDGPIVIQLVACKDRCPDIL